MFHLYLGLKSYLLFYELFFIAMKDPEVIPRLHGALKAKYGSDCNRNLNTLSSLLRKRATTSAGLRCLLKCRQYHVFPAFITRSIKFSQLGWHLECLAEKLPARMLRAATRDIRSHLARLQGDVDAIWLICGCRICRQLSIIPEKTDWWRGGRRSQGARSTRNLGALRKV